MKRIILFLLSITLLSASTFALATDTIAIGGIVALTGEPSPYGIAIQQGVDLYVKQINEHGGIHGKQVIVDWQDTKGTLTDSINAYQHHYKNKVSGIIGTATSGNALVVADFAGDDGIPMITPSASNYDVTTPGRGYNVFRVCMMDQYQGEIMAMLANILGFSKVAVLYDNTNDYSSGIATAFWEKTEELGIEMVAFETCTAIDMDFSKQLASIASTEAEAILIPMYYNALVLIAEQAKEFGITAPFFGCDGWDGILTQSDNPSIFEGAYFVSHYPPVGTSELLADFEAAFEVEYGTLPNSVFSALGYDAIAVLLHAIETSGDFNDWDTINKAIQTSNYHGLTGNTLKFNNHGDPAKVGVVIQIVGGEYQVVGYIKP